MTVAKKIYNPITGKWYKVRRRKSPQKPGTIKGLWQKPKKKSGRSIWDLIWGDWKDEDKEHTMENLERRFEKVESDLREIKEDLRQIKLLASKLLKERDDQ